MNVPAILFLLGLTPTAQPTHTAAAEWNQLSQTEKQSIIRQFEAEYKVEAKSLTPAMIENLKRKMVLRSWDQMGSH